ncbi:hypothetical protein LCGC14_2276570, partial [marine sediment metagenome]
GWTKGDVALAGIGQQFSDGGVWSKAVTSTTDERVPIFGYEWAIPICLIHRKNGAAWSWSTNPNGTGVGRPDGHVSSLNIMQDDILDLRRQVDVDEARLAEMLESDIDKLLRGELRTRMAIRWAGTAGAAGVVAGTRLLQTDHTNAASNAFRMTAPNGTRKLWSDAKEFVPMATSFPLDAGFSDAYVTYTVATGVLLIKAPAGSHLVRNIPASFIVGSDTGAATFLQFKGEPCWTTQSTPVLAYPSPSSLKWIDAVTGNIEEQNVFDNILGTELATENPAFTITASDTLGRATQMSITLTSIAPYASADVMTVNYWVHFDRTTVGAEYVSQWGLAEVPDIVYSVYKDPSGANTEVNVGTLYTIVRKSVAASTDAVITSADVLAASGTSGATAIIVGFDAASLTYSAAPAGAFVSATLDAPQTTLTLTHAAPIAADVDVVVYYYTAGAGAVTDWIEVGRGGKSVRAYYSWHEEIIDFGGAPAQTYAFDLATSVWHAAEIGGRMAPMPIVWESATGVGGPWTYVAALGDGVTGYQYSNLVSFDANAYVSQRYCLVVVPKWSPPAAAASDEFLINYSYLPYQGLSSTGGVAA